MWQVHVMFSDGWTIGFFFEKRKKILKRDGMYGKREFMYIDFRFVGIEIRNYTLDHDVQTLIFAIPIALLFMKQIS